MTLAIIAGTARGRRLDTLPGDATRPTTAKVRAALFNILVAWTAGNRWLDLFAGSGAVGLEAASRGAVSVVLVENQAEAAELIRKNVAKTQLKAEIWNKKAVPAVKMMTDRKFDVVFLDPPYAIDPIPTLEAVVAAGILASDGRLVVEHHVERQLPDAIGTWTRRDTRTYAETALTFYGEGPAQTAPEAELDAPEAEG